MGDLHNKTLLLLGGSSHQVCAIEAARRLGVRTVLCDYLPNNPGREVAHAYYEVSTTDRERVLGIARNEHVDGVLAFGTDVAAPTAAYVAQELGLPTNPLESVEILTHKQLFRSFMERSGFPTPLSVTLSSGAGDQELHEAIERLAPTVVVKPTDSSGSKGVSVLVRPTIQSLREALVQASQWSRSGVLIVEDFVESSYPYLIGGDVFVEDGTIVFWGLMDSLSTGGFGLIPCGKAYPLGMDAQTLASVKRALQRIVDTLGLRFGEMNVEVFLGPGLTPYVMEFAPRAGGNLIPLQLQDISGIDLVRTSVLGALGLPMGSVAFDGADRYLCTSVLHSTVSGVFDHVEYAPSVRNKVYREALNVVPGDSIKALGNASDAIGVAFFEFDAPEELRRFEADSTSYVSVRLR